jgi:hypothetical protein
VRTATLACRLHSGSPSGCLAAGAAHVLISGAVIKGLLAGDFSLLPRKPNPAFEKRYGDLLHSHKNTEKEIAVELAEQGGPGGIDAGDGSFAVHTANDQGADAPGQQRQLAGPGAGAGGSIVLSLEDPSFFADPTFSVRQAQLPGRVAIEQTDHAHAPASALLHGGHGPWLVLAGALGCYVAAVAAYNVFGDQWRQARTADRRK